MKTLIITSLSSLFLLLPAKGGVVHEPVKPYSVKPKVQKIIKDTPLKTIEPIEAVPVPEPVYVAPAPVMAVGVTSCGSDPQMAYIYTVESGCRTNAINPGGCIGLGQACPGSKLPCSLSDWVCQDNWFRNYAVAAYGSIYNAYIFRQGHNWW